MGRKKIRIARISDERNRQVTFQKRKAGLLKKAFELSVLCEAEVAVLIFPPAGASGPPRMYDYASTSLQAVLDRLAAFAGERETRENSSFHDPGPTSVRHSPSHPLAGTAASAAANAFNVPATFRVGGGGVGGGGGGGGGGGDTPGEGDVGGSSESADPEDRRHAVALHSMHMRTLVGAQESHPQLLLHQHRRQDRQQQIQQQEMQQQRSQMHAQQQAFPRQALAHPPAYHPSLAAGRSSYHVQQTQDHASRSGVREIESVSRNPGHGLADGELQPPPSAGATLYKQTNIRDMVLPSKADAAERPTGTEFESEEHEQEGEADSAPAPSRKNMFKRLRVQIPTPTVAGTRHSPRAGLGNGAFYSATPSSAPRWQSAWPPLPSGLGGGGSSMLPLLPGQPGVGPGTSRGHHGQDHLWTPHGSDFPADPLMTPKGAQGFAILNGTAFPPLPSPSNAGLLPFPSARASGPLPVGMPTATGASAAAAAASGPAGSTATSGCVGNNAASSVALAGLTARPSGSKTPSPNSKLERQQGGSGSTPGKRSAEGDAAQGHDSVYPGSAMNDFNSFEGNAASNSN
jgi:SRF-type transcription factor (DNA-binding and dimerisation domain)